MVNLSQIVVYYYYYIVVSLLLNVKSQIIEISHPIDASLSLKYTIWTNVSASGYSSSTMFCHRRNQSLPKADELKYFFKSLPIDRGQSIAKFYLADVLEGTSHYPENYQRLCLMVKKTSSGFVNLNSGSSEGSCSETANRVVCVGEIRTIREVSTRDSPTSTLPPRIVFTYGEAICQRAELFYIQTGLFFALFILSGSLIAFLAYRSCKTTKSNDSETHMKSATSDIKSSLPDVGNESKDFNSFCNNPLSHSQHCIMEPGQEMNSSYQMSTSQPSPPYMYDPPESHGNHTNYRPSGRVILHKAYQHTAHRPHIRASEFL